MIRLIKKNINDFKKNGLKIIPKKIFTLIKILFAIPIYIVSIPLLLIIRIIKPLILIRFSIIVSTRIGHFAGIYSQYLCELDLNIDKPKQKYFDFFVFSEVCNSQIEKFWRKKLRILPSYLFNPLIRINKIIPGGPVHEAIFFDQEESFSRINKFKHRDVNNLLDQTNPHVSFTSEELEIAESQASKIGIEKNDKLVLLHIRDEGYLEEEFPSIVGNWNYSNIKNCDINNYLPGIKKLINLGYKVVRYGKNPKNYLKLNDKNFIDLAKSSLRTDLLEVYLVARCSFLIGSNTGGSYYPIWLFRKPSIISNYVPISTLHTYSDKILTYPKIYCYKSNNKKLTISEIFEKKYSYLTTQEEFDESDIYVKEHSSEDNSLMIMEMLERVENKWIETEEEINLRKSFIEIYLKNIKKDSYFFRQHGKIRCNFGFVFLKNNKEIIR